jgi:tRNA A-37 threonylcarbamoyl transferase component Bud32
MTLPEDVLKVTLKRMIRAGLLAESAGQYQITDKARDRFERQLLTEDTLLGKTISGRRSLNLRKPLQGDYDVKTVIGRGSTSITFLAEQKATHKDRALKVFLTTTVTMDKLDAALTCRNCVQSDCIPEVIEAGEIEVELSGGTTLTTCCVVMLYVDSTSQTLDKYLESHENIDSSFLERFVEHLGGAMCEIEKAGLRHGDLHEGNVLVQTSTTGANLPRFWVIDFVGVPSTGSLELDHPSDMENFRNHLLRAALVACNRVPGYSARLLLGERVFRIVQSLRSGSYQTFADLMRDYHRDATLIPQDFFEEPAHGPFEWLRVEFIPDASWLYRLFEPIESWFAMIAKFGNICISGPRGCGKSHYLRVLAFQPQALASAEKDQALHNKLQRIGYDFHRLFGVLFACRLGEFKAFTPDAIGQSAFDLDTILFLKHILVLKIWNQTLNTILEGIATESPLSHHPVLSSPTANGANDFVDFVTERLGNIAGIESDCATSILKRVTAVCIARENSATSVWHKPAKRPEGRRLDERDLHEFFSMMRRLIPDLHSAQFAVLVDDATEGHMCFEYQCILNSLIRASHDKHCFKLTHEKYRYTLDSADGRPIDPRNELEFVDLGETSVRAQKKRSKADLAKYMARVVNRRLEATGYVPNIVHILGQSQNPTTFLTHLAPLTKRRSTITQTDSFQVSVDTRKSRALYAGWNIIWQLSHGSIRTLLEIIEEIFRDAKVEKTTRKVSLQDQDLSVRNYSVRKFRALSLIPGEIDGKSLGEALQDVLSAIGEISWRYLVSYDTGSPNRWYETISVDRNERGGLEPCASRLLAELLKHDLLLAEGMNYSRSQIGLGVRYDLNKVFTPAFRTTYRVRNHLYVSNATFSELLAHPGQFVRAHARKLGSLQKTSRDRSTQRGLFDES